MGIFSSHTCLELFLLVHDFGVNHRAIVLFALFLFGLGFALRLALMSEIVLVAILCL